MQTSLRMRLSDWFSSSVFRWVHGHHLVYNTCWEDPRLDRQALELTGDDTLLMITSAGCNALDYAVLGPKAIHAVDVNPRQNALLELKMAGIRRLDHEAFFAMFGRGFCRHAASLYHAKLRADLTPLSRSFWDRRIGAFASERGSFYFHGTSGVLAWTVNHYIDKAARVRPALDELLRSRDVGEQRAIYTHDLHGAFWKGFVRWAMNRDSTLSLLGVPRPQRQQVERTYPGGIGKFIEDRVTAVFTQLPIYDNYFWRVYLTGRYTTDCCPEYLKPEPFAKLKAGLVDRIQPHTTTLLDFLTRHPGRISRFVLLDHMDWLSTHHRPALAKQWQALVDRATPDARLLWRSGGMNVDFLDDIAVSRNGRAQRLGDVLVHHRDLADRLHAQDRVNTYGSFYIADLAAA